MARDPTPGVPLRHYLTEHAGVGVRFTCLSCMAYHDAPMADVLARLKATGLGDEQTGIRQVGLQSTRPCRRCGAINWETIPAWSGRMNRKP